MTHATTITVSGDGLELRISRRLAAPPALVFRCFTQAEHLRHWWGPARYELVTCEVDARTGGGYRFVQRGPEGDEYAFHGEFLELDPPGRLVQTFVFEGAPEETVVETLTLTADGDGTLLYGISRFPGREALDAALQSGMTEGMEETYERLETYVASATAAV